jgi:polyhydroxybutyrate depolymerase
VAGAHTVEQFTGPRPYLLHAPAGWDGRSALPVVMVLHGAGGTPEWALDETGWAATADRHGFLVVLPEGTRRAPDELANFLRNPPVWNDGSPRAALGQPGVDDVAFLGAVLDDVAARHRTDGRVCLTGFSNGAGMAFRFAAERPERLTALAPVAGYCWVQGPAPVRPVPTLYLIGDRDPLVPLAGGEVTVPWGGPPEHRPPVADTLARWARLLGLFPDATPVSDQDGVRVERYGQGEDGAVLEAWTVEGLGHHWPGGKGQLSRRLAGPPSRRVRANEVIWDFFRRQWSSPGNGA